MRSRPSRPIPALTPRSRRSLEIHHHGQGRERQVTSGTLLSERLRKYNKALLHNECILCGGYMGVFSLIRQLPELAQGMVVVFHEEPYQTSPECLPADISKLWENLAPFDAVIIAPGEHSAILHSLSGPPDGRGAATKPWGCPMYPGQGRAGIRGVGAERRTA